MRYQRDLIDNLRARTDLVEVVADYVDLKRQGRSYVGLCPFHPEKTPSFSVRKDRQYFKCFGCDATGDVFTFIQLIQGISFPRAIAVLVERSGLPIAPSQLVDARCSNFPSETLALADLFRIGLTWTIEDSLEEAKAPLLCPASQIGEIDSERIFKLTGMLEAVQNWTVYQAAQTYLDLKQFDPAFVAERVERAFEAQAMLAQIIWAAGVVKVAK